MAAILSQVPEGGISFLELLLNENLCAGTIKVEKKLAVQAGGVNSYLEAKQKYELLLRIALDSHIVLEHKKEIPGKQYEVLTDDTEVMAKNCGWKTDCYVIGKYSEILREQELFDLCLKNVLEEAEKERRAEQTIAYLEKMIQRTESYWCIDEGSRPILIYREGREDCDVLNDFADQFGMALTRAGKKVILFDCLKDGADQWPSVCMDQHFQAAVGMQSAVFSKKWENGNTTGYLHERLYGPKYNFLFDHPVWMLAYLEHDYPDFYLLTHDADYVKAAKRYLNKKAYLFPVAGTDTGWNDNTAEKARRIYDITFVGIYGDYWKEILLIHEMDRDMRFTANRFLLKMRKNPDFTAEKALEETLLERGIALEEKAFAQLLYQLRRAVYCVMRYYRDRVVRLLLESGFRIDVFGESWTDCPLRKYPNLICHPALSVAESRRIWRQSKLSLNIMSWHKAGFTERMVQIMLEGALLVTDDTTYLHGKYGENDLLVFRLNEMEQLPDKVRRLLMDDSLRERIAENGRQKTRKQHTWDKRAEQFLEILHSRMESRVREQYE